MSIGKELLGSKFTLGATSHNVCNIGMQPHRNQKFRYCIILVHVLPSIKRAHGFMSHKCAWAFTLDSSEATNATFCSGRYIASFRTHSVTMIPSFSSFLLVSRVILLLYSVYAKYCYGKVYYRLNGERWRVLFLWGHLEHFESYAEIAAHEWHCCYKQLYVHIYV